MISLGTRDATKELGLGFGGRMEMEDTELEEGEACSDHSNGDDYDASMDPDIALSYIDEKLQDVLGHFQKDFEGGVSAENLGSKFGGYGSFLPTYQRSPVWSHPNIPPKNQHYDAPGSPNSWQVQAEGGLRGSVSSSTAPQSVKLEPAPASAVSRTASKAPSSMMVSVKQEVGMPSDNLAKEHALRYESVNKKFTNFPDQKMLKLRIKVGSDNLSTQKNAAIYSGLGLDVSPSSSLDDSPSGSEGMSNGPQDSLFESPAYILRIMTSFPVHGGVMLSPLSGDLIHLTEKVMLHDGNGSLPVVTVGPESLGIVVNGSDSIKGDGKMFEEKKIRSLERDEASSESKSENNKDSRSGFDTSTKEERDIDEAFEELVSNTLKLPLLSNSYSVTDATEGMLKTSKIARGLGKEKGFSDLKKEEPLEPIYMHEDAWVENSKATSSGKIWEDNKASSIDRVPVHPRKDSRRKGEKPYGSVKSESNISKEMKAVSSEPTDTPKQKSYQKVHEQGSTKFPSGKEHPSSDGKKKPKRNQNHGNIVEEMPKDALSDDFSLMSKNKKIIHADNYATKRELEDSKSQNYTGKAANRYRDFFGDMEIEQEEKQTSPLSRSCEDRQKDSGMGQKNMHFCNALKERPSGQKIDKLSTSEVHPEVAFSNASCPGNGQLCDAGPAATEDNWVCCDKCQKWRLLPLGKNPNDLPEKWLCGMLNWLPGMNRCSFTEEETTNAVMALNHVSALASQHNLQINHGGAMSKMTVLDDHLDHNQQNFGSHAMPVDGQKKACKDGNLPFTNYVKKKIQSSLTNGNLNNVNQSVESGPDFPKLSKSSDFAVEKHKHKQKVKNRVLDNSSDGGDTRRIKMKGKRDHQQDFFRASKKIRAEGLHQDLVSDHANIEKVGPSSSNGFPAMSSGKNLPKNNSHTSSKDKAQISARKSKDEVIISMHDVPMNMGKQDDVVARKRKIDESHDSQVNPVSLLNTGPIPKDSGALAKEEFSENEYRRENKASLSTCGKDSSASKGNGRMDKKGSHGRNRKLGQDVVSSLSRRSLDGLDSLRRDSGSQHPSTAATSSSSKVSGSHKTKVNFHDTKGSPVESVSSSPLRVSKQGGQIRCSDGEDDGGSDRSGTAEKEKILDAAYHCSRESSALDFHQKDCSHVSGGKPKQQILPSPGVINHHFANCSADYLGQDVWHPSKTNTADHCHDDGRQPENHYDMNGSHPRKSGKGSSSSTKDKNRSLNSELDNGKVMVSDYISEQAPTYEVKQTDGKNKTEEKFGVRYDEGKNRYIDKKDSVGLLLSESSKRESQSKFQENNSSDIKAHNMFIHDAMSTPNQGVMLDCEAVSARGKSPSLPSSGDAQNGTSSHCPQLFSGSQKGNGVYIESVINAFESDNASKSLKQIRKVDHPNGHHNSSRDLLSNMHRTRDIDAPSPVKRDSSSQAATNALKEAKNLKHLADRLKNSVSSLESTRLYFEAALKFLHGASLLESCSIDSAKSGEMIQSMQVYSSTAKLCEFCAHEYEKSKDMASAALVYKCMEVAYMRVIYSSHSSANKDRHELQTALQMLPPGESPSSSASDVDNMNHPATLEKGSLAKGISSPQVTGSHVIAAQKRPNFVKLLTFSQDVNFAMEASRKSRIAFAAANINLAETQQREGISSIKTALDFNFLDVDGLLRLIRLAIETISR